MIDELIDKQDNFQIIGQQIGAIILQESINQQALANGQGKDTDPWKLRVFSERSYPFESWLGSDTTTDTTPIVNVTYTGSEFDKSSSNVGEAQKCTAQYNIDCYAIGVSKSTSGGHDSADEISALEVQRVLTLVRNIIMHPLYCYLELRGMVWHRWAETITVFDQQNNDLAAHQISAGRIPLTVTFSEFTAQISGQPLEYVAVDVLRHETGELYFAAHYDYLAGVV